MRKWGVLPHSFRHTYSLVRIYLSIINRLKLYFKTRFMFRWERGKGVIPLSLYNNRPYHSLATLLNFVLKNCSSSRMPTSVATTDKEEKAYHISWSRELIHSVLVFPIKQDGIERSNYWPHVLSFFSLNRDCTTDG